MSVSVYLFVCLSASVRLRLEPEEEMNMFIVSLMSTVKVGVEGKEEVLLSSTCCMRNPAAIKDSFSEEKLKSAAAGNLQKLTVW